jgi:diguanylate cyclase (GGDEF)-like protein
VKTSSLRIRNFIKLLSVTFLFLMLVSQECLAERKKRVLVLHSYHQGLEWTDNITKGIQTIFGPFHDHYEVHYEYLDTKRNTGNEYMDQLVKFTNAKNHHIRYAVVIASDNSALRLINEGQLVFPGSPPIVFCGINHYSSEMTSGIKEVTGVVEATDHRATIELMRELHPERRNIIVILDKTPTGEAIREELRSIESIYKGEVKFEFFRDFLLEEIPEKLGGLGEKDLIYILTFNRDRNMNFISYAEGIEMIARSTDVPIYGSWDFYMDKGIIGGRITSGVLQGEEAAKLTLKLLQGKKANDLKVITDSPTRYMFDYKHMEKYGIDRSSLPTDSQVINLPPTAYERHRTFLVGITISSFLVVFILLQKYRQQQSILKAKNALAQELERKVQERTRALEAANKELTRLSNMDGLTQLYNRRYFDNMLKAEISRSQRLSLPISLLICDIDYFKRYNDTYGHLAGDDCIRAVADTIHQHSKRVSDVAARYGGEEFAVILPNTGAEEARAIAESIRHAIELLKLPHGSSSVKSVVSISIGVGAMTPSIHTKPSKLVGLADEALYESKSNGRDRVSVNSI